MKSKKGFQLNPIRFSLLVLLILAGGEQTMFTQIFNQLGMAEFDYLLPLKQLMKMKLFNRECSFPMNCL